MEHACKVTDFNWFTQIFPHIFPSILPLFSFYFASTVPLPFLYGLNVLLLASGQASVPMAGNAWLAPSKPNVPMVGMDYSHHGNIESP
jgi:hypothetical protein